jgi:hypothetical protein
MKRLAARVVIHLLGFIAAGAASAAEFWTPRAGVSFSIILSVLPVRVETPAKVVDLDLFDTRAATVADLKRRGKRVICYLSAGTWENWRHDKSDFPRRVIGRPYDDWPGERWLDIADIEGLAPVMRSRLDRCKAKGFDGVDPDNIDVYQANSGFRITRADAIRYLRFLATEAHKRGLAIGLKNVTELSDDVLPRFQFAVTEDCFDQGFCGESKNFIEAGKPVFAIEYTDNGISFRDFCRRAERLGLSPLLKPRNLGVWERRCPS